MIKRGRDIIESGSTLPLRVRGFCIDNIILNNKGNNVSEILLMLKKGPLALMDLNNYMMHAINLEALSRGTNLLGRYLFHGGVQIQKCSSLS